MKIFIGLIEIAGYYKNLKKGFQQIGVDCTYVNLSSNKFNYGDDDTPTFVVKWMKKVISQIRRSALEEKKIKKILYIRLLDFLKIIFFIWALSKHDIFIFGFGSSFFGTNIPFFRHWDLPILKFFKKKIIFTFHGSDSRPPYMDGSVMTQDERVTIKKCIQITKDKKKHISMIDKYADVMIDIPPQGLFHERPFVLNLFMGLPYDLSNSKSIINEGSMIRIIHAPSNPEAKGTREIHQAIENLKKKGHIIDFIEIINMPNAVVLDQIARCDMVVDQIYADYAMPGFATEAAWYGKPVIIGGYAQDVWNFLPHEKKPPTYYCRPEEIEQAIEKLIIDKEYRIMLGKSAQKFVQAEWTPKKIAERYMDLIEGVIPEEWLYDPNNIRYTYGYALTESRAKKIIRNIIMDGGIGALQLTDKPELENEMMIFAELK